ncbi:hypothetical protein RI054_33g128370 [Pseudoscourfieldia marina]
MAGAGGGAIRAIQVKAEGGCASPSDDDGGGAETNLVASLLKSQQQQDGGTKNNDEVVVTRTMRFNFATLEANPEAVSRTSDYESTPNALRGSFAILIQDDKEDGNVVPKKTTDDDVVDIPSWITQPVQDSSEALFEKLFYGPEEDTDFDKSMRAIVEEDDVYKSSKAKLIEAEKALKTAESERGPRFIRETRDDGRTTMRDLHASSSLNDDEKKKIDTCRKCIQEVRNLSESKYKRLREICANIQYSSRVASISARVTADDALELHTHAMLKGKPYDFGSFDFGKPLRRRQDLPTVKVEPGTAPTMVKTEHGKTAPPTTSTPREGGGSMTRLPEIMQSDPGKATELCLNRGGEIVLRGSDEDGHTFVLRLYVVIAAHDPGDDPDNVPISVPNMQASSSMALRQWQETSPVVAFRTFLMGTSEQTTSRVRKLHGAEMALKTIASQVGALPHWDELARRVENARSRCFGKTLEIPLGAHSFPETSVMVEEYKRFLRIKHKAKDYASTDLSPPMEEDNITGVKLLDEIWHIHIAMPSYDDDCRAFTGGYVMQHVPALADEAYLRYQRVWQLFQQDEEFEPFLKAYEYEEQNLSGRSPVLDLACVYMRIWPRTVQDWAYEPGDGGCC